MFVNKEATDLTLPRIWPRAVSAPCPTFPDHPLQCSGLVTRHAVTHHTGSLVTCHVQCTMAIFTGTQSSCYFSRLIASSHQDSYYSIVKSNVVHVVRGGHAHGTRYEDSTQQHSPDGGFGVEKVFLFLCAGTLLDLLLADLVTPRSVSSSPIPATGDILVKLIIVTCSGNFLSHQPFTSIHYYFSNYNP